MKTVEQQSVMMLHRTRLMLTRQRSLLGIAVARMPATYNMMIKPEATE